MSTPNASALNVAAIRTALTNAKTEVQNAVTAAVTAAQKNPILLKGLSDLVKVNGDVDKALARLDSAIERTTPKAKEEEADAPAAGTAKEQAAAAKNAKK